MPAKLNKKGLSLTELIVASILITIVLAGVAGFSISLRQIEQTSGQAAVLNTRTSAAINHIKNNAFTAIGYKNDSGVRTDITEGTTPPPNFFSFRHDVLNTPIDYTDDEWTIYTDGGITNIMYVCTQESIDNGEGPIPMTLSGQPCEPPNGMDPDNLTLLNNVVNIIYEFDPNATAPEFYFYIQITTRSDPSKAADPLKNPEVTMEDSISPISHTW